MPSSKITGPRRNSRSAPSKARPWKWISKLPCPSSRNTGGCGLRRISRLGRITYEALHFEGDNSVKNHVIARYLAAEAEAQADGSPSLAVTPANYKFKYKGPRQSGGGETVEVFQVTPQAQVGGPFQRRDLDRRQDIPVRPRIRPAGQTRLFS
jgi:hypothetical protein